MRKSVMGIMIVLVLIAATTTAVCARGLGEAVFEQPALITAVGQSADGKLADVLFKKAGIEHSLKTVAQVEDLAGVKTLVLVIGGSSKGLGAAGIKASDEEARAKSLSEAAQAQGIKVIAMHIGGENRRGDLTNRYIAPSIAKADYAIVVQSGDSDGVFAKGMGDKPLDYAEKMVDVAEIVKKAFK